jgi:hypothetical protein
MIETAVGPRVEIQQCTYVVIAKSIRAEDLRRADPAEVAKETN